MSFWKAGIGGMIGFSIGGPIGGILGAIIGSKLSGKDQVEASTKQRNQAAFFTALFACFAKIAKADGKVTREEVDKVDHFIKRDLNFPLIREYLLSKYLIMLKMITILFETMPINLLHFYHQINLP